MEKKEVLIVEPAPPDESTYEKGSLEMETIQPKDEYGSFSFSEALKEDFMNG